MLFEGGNESLCIYCHSYINTNLEVSHVLLSAIRSLLDLQEQLQFTCYLPSFFLF